MKGEYEEICKKICSESATIDHGTDHESGNNCDICRGTVFLFKGSYFSSHFIFEINVGKKRIRQRTTLKLNL